MHVLATVKPIAIQANGLVVAMLLVMVVLLVYGLAHEKLHKLIMVISVLIIILMAFAIIYGKVDISIMIGSQ